VRTPAGDVTATYCTNIHPASNLDEVQQSIERYSGELKRRLSPNDPFAIGLRLSDVQAKELLTSDALVRFRDLLGSLGVYVCAINGFPFGEFHTGKVKDNVHRPDWRDEHRVEYTVNLARILSQLLPTGSHGGISTSPLSYKPWSAMRRSEWSIMTENIARTARTLAQLSDEFGVDLHLDIEPEPDGLIATSDEFVAWFQEHLQRTGARSLASATGKSHGDACDELRRRVGVCLDTCHAAVEFEEPSAVLGNYEQAGVRIGRVQVSSALRVMLAKSQADRASVLEMLTTFAESTYLHQTIGRRLDGSLTRWSDLPDALSNLTDTDCNEWRIHYHVPIFLRELGDLSTTQRQTQELIEQVRRRKLCDLFEVETYTWSVLPVAMRMSLTDSIERELRWLVDELNSVR